MIVHTVSQIDRHLATIELSTKQAIAAIAALTSPTDALRQMKFGKREPILIGCDTASYELAIQATASIVGTG